VSGSADPASADYCYLTTTGRVTGRPHRIEIWFGLSDGIVYLLAGDRERADWVRNLLASPQVLLELAGELRPANARVLEPGTAEDALARRLLVEKYQPGYGEDLTEWGRTSLAVAVERT
jgi:deazaflavin-dependent oxidoreductase (nitroreductase family)